MDDPELLHRVMVICLTRRMIKETDPEDPYVVPDSHISFLSRRRRRRRNRPSNLRRILKTSCR